MNKPHIYLLNVFLTVLLIFSFLLSSAALLVHCKALSTQTCVNIAEEKNLAEKAHSELTQYFRDQENTTAIPLSVYEKTITTENCEAIIRSSIENGFAYLNGRTATVGAEFDFSSLNADLRAFFSDYADQNGIQKDDAFEKAVKNTQNAAKQRILTACDVFRFRTLADAGVLSKAQRVAKWSLLLVLGALLLLALTVFGLFLCNRKSKRHMLYWCGIGLMIASVLMLIPACWLSCSRWFDRFAIKTDQVFAAVTGYLYSMTGAVTVLSICGFIAGALMLAGFIVLHIRSGKAASLQTTKH